MGAGGEFDVGPSANPVTVSAPPTTQNGIPAGVRAGLPFAIAAGLLAISFGVLARPVMGTVAPIVMSAIVFAGSAQFAATAVLAAGGGPVAAVVAGILLNARYGPMGIALAPSLRGGALRRAAHRQAMIDASWAMASLGAAVALALVPMVPPGVPVIAASVGALLGLAGAGDDRDLDRPAEGR